MSALEPSGSQGAKTYPVVCSMNRLRELLLFQDRMRVHSLRSALVQVSLTFRWNSFDPFPPKISLVIPLTVCHTTLIILLGEFGIGSTNNLLIGIFLYSHHLPA